MDNGFAEVPEEIVQELKDLCLHIPPKRDQGDAASRPTKMTRISDNNAMSLLGSAAENGSLDSFSAHPPPFQLRGPREPPEMRARGSRNRMRDQDPCLLSTSMLQELPTADEGGIIQDHSVSPATSIPHVGPEPPPADVCAAALRTTEARRESFSSLCDAIEAYNEAVRCEAHLRGAYGLPFSH